MKREKDALQEKDNNLEFEKEWHVNLADEVQKLKSSLNLTLTLTLTLTLIGGREAQIEA